VPGAAAITGFGLDVSGLHRDLAAVWLCGGSPEADEEYPDAARAERVPVEFRRVPAAAVLG